MRSSSSWLILGATAALISAPRIADAAPCVPGFDFAAFGKNSVGVRGSSTSTDGYDSSVGDYSTTKTPTTGGNLGTNSTTCANINFSGGPNIGGDVKYGAGSSCPNPGTISGTTSAQSSNPAFPSVTFPALVGTVQGNKSGTMTLASTPNNTYGTVDVGNGATLTLSGGTYIFDSMDVKGTVKVTAASVVYLKCAISSQAMKMNNGDLNPGSPQKSTNLVFMLGPACSTATFNGGSNTAYAVYAPDTDVTISGGNDIFGAIVGKTIDFGGNTSIHYDRALANFATGTLTCATSTETSRASPVVALLNGSTPHVVQGSFENPTGTQATLTTIASVASFTFPYLKGHMRARVASSIGTAATGFSAGTIYFDAGATGNIATATYTGCTAFDGSCRQIFTNTNASATTGSTFHPSTSSLADGTSAAIGALIAPTTLVPGIAAAQWQTIVRKVLDAKLGGVDRSTVAVIEPSTFAGVSTRPTIAYFGAADGMLHAVCAQATGGRTPSHNGSDICTGAGKEIWAFLPRVQLPLIASNTAKIDGSVRVADVYGDFTNNPATGTKGWRTILTFQTGYAVGSTAAVYALDITDPAAPVLLWEYTKPTTPGSSELGTGLVIAMAAPFVAGQQKNMVVAQTSNGGTGGTGMTAIALSQETGEQIWKFGYLYPSPPRTVAADLPLPTLGIPGGAVGVDATGLDYISDFVMGDLYGNLWRLNALDGSSRNGTTTPLFSFSTNKHPIGAPPAIYKSGGTLYAAFATGGYADPVATTWTTAQQYLIGVKLNSTATTAVDETASPCSTCTLAVNQTLTSGDKSFSQVLVVGTQLFVTTDSQDVNASTYGTSTAQTGHLTSVGVTGGTATVAVITSGATSLANSGSTLYSSSRNVQEQLSTTATTTGEKVDLESAPKISRNLWLRSE